MFRCDDTITYDCHVDAAIKFSPKAVRQTAVCPESFLVCIQIMLQIVRQAVFVGMQAGDVPVTYADSEALEKDYGFRPQIGIREGLRNFAEWYKEYYG